MPPLVRRDIWLDSSDGHTKIAGYIYSHPYVAPFCALQISHGMCEHMARYEEAAGHLTQRGVAVCGHDHLGHGASAAAPRDLGYFSGKGGRRFVLADLKAMNDKIHGIFPQLPVVLLGHSMGSFYARRYAARWPASIEGLILSGTAGPSKAAGLGIALADGLARVCGERHRSKLVHRVAFGTYLKRIANPKTPYDWLSRDEKVVAAFCADALCGFRFTLSGMAELFAALQDVSGPAWAASLRKNMPVLMIQGGEDPVGNYAAGTDAVRRWLRAAGVSNVEYITYPGARHEVLNETNRTQVFADVLAYLNRWWRKR